MDDRPVFDAAKFKTTTRAQWQAAAEAWHRWGPFLGEWLGPATEQMLDLARIQGRHRVLDIAAGAGEQSIAAARRVGPTGHVLATDIAPALLDYALTDARAAGLSNIETRELDGEAARHVARRSFDAVICTRRPDLLSRPAARVDGIRRALKPGGRFAAVVYSTPEKNALLLDSGRHYSPTRQTATAIARPAWPFLTRRRRCASRGVRARRPQRDRGAQAWTRPYACPAPLNACASSANRSAPCIR